MSSRDLFRLVQICGRTTFQFQNPFYCKFRHQVNTEDMQSSLILSYVFLQPSSLAAVNIIWQYVTEKNTIQYAIKSTYHFFSLCLNVFWLPSSHFGPFQSDSGEFWFHCWLYIFIRNTSHYELTSCLLFSLLQNGVKMTSKRHSFLLTLHIWIYKWCQVIHKSKAVNRFYCISFPYAIEVLVHVWVGDNFFSMDFKKYKNNFCTQSAI